MNSDASGPRPAIPSMTGLGEFVEAIKYLGNFRALISVCADLVDSSISLAVCFPLSNHIEGTCDLSPAHWLCARTNRKYSRSFWEIEGMNLIDSTN